MLFALIHLKITKNLYNKKLYRDLFVIKPLHKCKPKFEFLLKRQFVYKNKAYMIYANYFMIQKQTFTDATDFLSHINHKHTYQSW